MIDYKIYLITKKGYESLGKVNSIDDLLFITDNIVENHPDMPIMVVEFDPEKGYDNAILVYYGVPGSYEKWRENIKSKEKVKKR